MRQRLLCYAALALFWVAPWVHAAPPAALVLASTTSTQNSGLLAHVLPIFTAHTGIQVKVVAVGTGQAMALARRGDADALLVHDPQAEAAFVGEGYGERRQPVMYNDFVLVGRRADALAIKGRTLASALAALAQSNAPFVSRGDRSGTHAAELRLWRAAGVEHTGTGYMACGCGMGAALNLASAKAAYTLTDRASWVSFKNKADLEIVVQGEPALFNPYAVIVVSTRRHAHVNQAGAQAFADWITSTPGQAAIANHRVGGMQLFFPSAN
ncbi:MAG: substrate-binding domain-containing protein [Proteobacteria bacterium]|nr:substrate-binding domain-containing protein [Pseudomonadota bacterium]